MDENRRGLGPFAEWRSVVQRLRVKESDMVQTVDRSLRCKLSQRIAEEV